MSIVRVNKTSNYTVMSNVHLRDSNISLTAKGLLSVALSLPDDWDYSIEGLCKYCNCGKDKLRTAMNELKDNGYLEIIKTNSQGGKFDYDYVFYETKQPDTEKPYLVEPDVVKPDVENPPQLNTKEANTKELNPPIIPQKKKNGKKNGCLSIETIMEEVDKRGFSDAVHAKLAQWVLYKEECSQYKTITGLNMQLSQLENVIKKRGEKAVLLRMDEAMSREWVGWNFDTIDAFNNDRPFVKVQQLDRKPKYKNLDSSNSASDEDRKNFQELAKGIREKLKDMKD